MMFYQLILGSPTKHAMYEAARAGLLTSFKFPGLTPQLINRYYQLTAATAKGNLDFTRKKSAFNTTAIKQANTFNNPSR